MKAWNIMVVDDQPANLKLMEDMLKSQGYAVRSFPRGRLALAAALQRLPDLILLDINMPEMDGFEVCRNLKSEPTLAAVPVIFLSALHETEDKVKAFRSGGVDYIAKPFQIEEVHARVETHLQLRALQKELECRNEELEETVALRTRQLTEALARLTILDQTKSDFLKLISHEFRTPLSGLLGVGDLLLAEFESSAGVADLREMYQESRQRILTILGDALLLTQIEVEAERWSPRPIRLSTILETIGEQVLPMARLRGVTVAVVRDHDYFVSADEGLLRRAIEALVETAVKFSEQGQAVRLVCQPAPDSLRITIESRGHTIPPAAIPKFFQIFSIGDAITPGGDLGLGPPLAQRILSLFGGSVMVENDGALGIRLTVDLQRAASPAV
jgi:two-component system, sensor histidine kinase and response regulator